MTDPKTINDLADAFERSAAWLSKGEYVARRDFPLVGAADYEAAAKMLRSAALSAAGEPVAWMPFEAIGPTWELDRGESKDGNEEDDLVWRVHQRSGSRNDREWTWLAEGPTPRAALAAALDAASPRPQPAAQAQPASLGEPSEKTAAPNSGQTAQAQPEGVCPSCGVYPSMACPRDAHEACPWRVASPPPTEAGEAPFRMTMATAEDRIRYRADPPAEGAASHPLDEAGSDAELLDWLERESATLECIDMPTGAGDAEVGYRVVTYHMRWPTTREVGVGATPREAIRAAIDAERLARAKGA